MPELCCCFNHRNPPSPMTKRYCRLARHPSSIVVSEVWDRWNAELFPNMEEARAVTVHRRADQDCRFRPRRDKPPKCRKRQKIHIAARQHTKVKNRSRDSTEFVSGRNKRHNTEGEPARQWRGGTRTQRDLRFMAPLEKKRESETGEFGVHCDSMHVT